MKKVRKLEEVVNAKILKPGSRIFIKKLMDEGEKQAKEFLR